MPSAMILSALLLEAALLQGEGGLGEARRTRPPRASMAAGHQGGQPLAGAQRPARAGPALARVQWARAALGDMALRHWQPRLYAELSRRLAHRGRQGPAYLRQAKEGLCRKLHECGLACQAEGRLKHLHSIHRKMSRRRLALNEVYDLIGLRIILRTTTECYLALQAVHSLWRPVPGRFKDYISLPKPNSYQSLHTTVFGPDEQTIEVQLRTEEMHRVAEEGIAAHWRYKQGRETFRAKITIA